MSSHGSSRKHSLRQGLKWWWFICEVQAQGPDNEKKKRKEKKKTQWWFFLCFERRRCWRKKKSLLCRVKWSILQSQKSVLERDTRRGEFQLKRQSAKLKRGQYKLSHEMHFGSMKQCLLGWILFSLSGLVWPGSTVNIHSHSSSMLLPYHRRRSPRTAVCRFPCLQRDGHELRFACEMH